MIRLISSIMHGFLFLGMLAGNLLAQAPAEDIRGPKPVIEIPVPEKPPVLLWCSIAAGLLVILVCLYFWKKRRKNSISLSPSEVALASLAELEKHPESLTAEVFADQAAQTIRRFIMERFGIAAPRRTTEEFLQALAREKGSPLVNESPHLQKFLSSCDLAKFAGSTLTAKQREELLQAARGFVTATSSSAQP